MAELPKQYVMSLLRRSGLMPLAESMRARVHAVRNLHANRRFAALCSDVPLPPTRLMHDPYGIVNHSWYWESGRKSAEALRRVIEENCRVGASPLRILEWGCGLARVIRHLADGRLNAGDEFFGSDYNRESIEWCQVKLPGMAFSVNGLAPPLPYIAGSFDFVYSLSVFTHLSEAMHQAWIDELLRVLKPGGFILLTLHGDYYRRKLLPEELQRYDSGDLVLREGFVEGGRMYTAFHGQRFVRERLLAAVEIVSHASSDNMIAPPQDVWLVRKK